MNMLEVWRKLEGVLVSTQEGASLDEMLLPPASREEVRNLEIELGVALPSEFKQSLIIHSGTVFWVRLWDSVSLRAPDKILDDWRRLLSSADNEDGDMSSSLGVNARQFDLKWIPIADQNGIPICLDLNPSPVGSLGQVILVDWEDGRVSLLAKSFLRWLTDGLNVMGLRSPRMN